MKINRHYVISIGALVIAAVFFLSFKYINKKLGDQVALEVQRVRTPSIDQNETDSISEIKIKHNVRRDLVATDLSGYAIIPQEDSRMLKGQQYWDVHAERTLEEGGTLNGDEWTPEQIDKQISRIDNRIQEYQSKVRTDRNDQYSQRKLQDLYMMRSTMKSIKDTIDD